MKKGYVNYTVGTVGIWVLSLGISLCFLGRAQAMEVLPAEKAGKAAAAKVVSDPQERILDLTVSADVRQLMEERGEEGIRLNVCTSSPKNLKKVLGHFRKEYAAGIKYTFRRVNCATVSVDENKIKLIQKDASLRGLVDTLQADGVATIPENEEFLEKGLPIPSEETARKGQAFSFPRAGNAQSGNDAEGIRPDDPMYDEQWQHPCTDIERGWQRFGFHHRTITIAMLDSGIDRYHPDLVENTNFEEGYDFVNNDPYADDDNGHGTFTSGIAAAVTNNGTGVAGVANAMILPIKVLDNRGWGLYSDIAAGLEYAIEKGVDVVNMSLGPVNDETLKRLCREAYDDNNIVLVGSAGNKNGAVPNPPAYWTSVIGVAALADYTGDPSRDCKTRWSWSGLVWGDDTKEGNVEVMAPGDGVIATIRGNTYGHGSGTSFAAPYVAGVAAGYVSITPWTNKEIRAHIREHADPIYDNTHASCREPNYPNDCGGYGRVDAYPFNDEE